MKPLTLMLVVTISIIISSCERVSTSGGVGTSASGLYIGTIEYSDYNTCGLNIPKSGTFEMTITSSGDVIFDPIGLTWGGNVGSVTLRNAIKRSNIKGSWTGVDIHDKDYSYKIDGRIEDGGQTISGTGYIEGSYEGCAEKFAGVFAGLYKTIWL